jgi:uncharacterized protein YacL
MDLQIAIIVTVVLSVVIAFIIVVLRIVDGKIRNKKLGNILLGTMGIMLIVGAIFALITVIRVDTIWTPASFRILGLFLVGSWCLSTALDRNYAQTFYQRYKKRIEKNKNVDQAHNNRLHEDT